MGCVSSEQNNNNKTTNEKSNNKNNKDWSILIDKKFGGRAIWLTTKQTRKLINQLNHDREIVRLHLDPISGTLILYANGKMYDEIPFTGYPVPCCYAVGVIPPGLRIARRDLWSSELINALLVKEKTIYNALTHVFVIGIITIISEYYE